MAVNKMKKLTLLAASGDIGRIVDELQRLSCVEVSNTPTFDGDAQYLSRTDVDAARAELARKISKITDALVVLHKNAKKIKGVIDGKEMCDITEFAASDKYARANNLLEKVSGLLARTAEIKSQQSRISAAASAFRPWLEYDLPLYADHTDCTEISLGMFPPGTSRAAIDEKLADFDVVLDFVSQDSAGEYCALLYGKDDDADVASALSSLGFLRANFKNAKGSAREEYGALMREMKSLDRERAEADEQIKTYARELSLLEMLSDCEKTRLCALDAISKCGRTDYTTMLTGFVPVRAVKKLENKLSEFDCAYELCEPDEDDDIPVELSNNGFAKNFEWVLGMYSYPKYGTFDPTFIMSIFYFIIFGIMFADVGYGALLVLCCFGGVMLLKPKPGMKRFLLMFGYCGFSSVIWGVIFGAYFGDFPIAFSANMLGNTPPSSLALWIDPLQNPMGFLLLSLGVGAVHLLAGMAVKAFILIRQGKVLDALFDIGSWWLLFAGLGMIFVNPDIGKWIAVGGVAALILTQGRHEKNILMKLFKGVGSLYDLIGYLSDLLSYSRILALGLASAVIAQVVNILATMSGMSFVGFFVMIFAFLIGHVMNLVINVLGTFVHTSRLQYIEFFGKFFVDGGRPFRPLEQSDEYTYKIN